MPMTPGSSCPKTEWKWSARRTAYGIRADGNILQNYGQQPGEFFQFRLGFYAGSDAHSYLPQPAITLLSCVVE